MKQRELIRISKFLSLVLRHRPEQIGLSLDQHGWAEVIAASILRSLEDDRATVCYAANDET